MYKKISFMLASFFGAGYFPVAPGTFGSLVTLPFAFVLAYYYGLYGVAALAVVSFIIGWIVSVEVLKYTKHDPSLIVIDEVCGQSITLLPLAAMMQGNTNVVLVLLVGFALFRLFDITKPFPAGWADKKIRNALGVMLDDVFAGCYGAICLWLINRCFNLFIGF
ncbi:MAG: phosphatidylglycerophosphatase A [Alphaproteobacteria bacterium]|nr:phosphatidylglycerophosphatase A [Alphaproteobacteria bacterium]